MTEKRIALFPGSFDPFTRGHESIVLRGLSLFDEIIIAIGSNALKDGYFSLENRERMIRDIFRQYPKVSVTHYDGLTVDFAKKIGAKYLLRGIRTAADFEYERAIAQMNKAMHPEIDSVMLLTTPEHTPINSTIVRDVIRNGGDASPFIPKGININDYK
ncbi:MAG: pantetheine-phosphate adenylyltransferase [Marinilabiliaceae bacterium]|jgi:pantetheine-phosphate adenylyltransferase|nr:pantetheine-phosphate adenylyltransferase [Marinilabiliaceae bacterium]